MEGKYGQARRVWVMDRGVVSEENLDFLRKRGAKYIVGTTRNALKSFEKELCGQDWAEVEFGVEVKIARHLDYGEEKFILCRSAGRKEKERAILENQIRRLDEKLQKVKTGILAGRLKDAAQIERRLGRWLGRYPKAERLIDAEVIKNGGHPVDLKIVQRPELTDWVEKTTGYYLLRTNLAEEDP